MAESARTEEKQKAKYCNRKKEFVLRFTPTVVNKLIERIEIHNNEKKHSHNNVKVDIYFTAVGLFDVPTEQQLINTMERVKQKKAEKSA